MKNLASIAFVLLAFVSGVISIGYFIISGGRNIKFYIICGIICIVLAVLSKATSSKPRRTGSSTGEDGE